MNISSIQPSSIQPASIGPIDPFAGAGAERASEGPEFRDILQGAIDQVEHSSSNATQSVQNFLSGDGDDLHSTALAVQRADLEFSLLMQVRNKVVSAYQEVMRMQM
jgi:flagellar hook-basal body complex protein FliE